ncbi:hypothetical protein MJO28_003109 [Puccinia striiformis f. sp. tritici]|uniref:Uncharacterized protein n=1 Tax=Puccinia striiformis f. sp. tritici TaxID=168172 RepID=A0ACC0ES79_9BASI|nr:hypothetical protein MJO28_003109 [Puccinia striiformis f. sp. tritici]
MSNGNGFTPWGDFANNRIDLSDAFPTKASNGYVPKFKTCPLVYTKGIFSGNADIKHLLPNESNRFTNINAEYIGLMKRVFKSPYVLEVIQIPEVIKTLVKLVEALSKLQKALDLLKILGNSRDILQVVKHLKKLFAGLSTLGFNSGATQIKSMCSQEGEEVPFSTPIILKNYPKINDWLT